MIDNDILWDIHNKFNITEFIYYFCKYEAFFTYNTIYELIFICYTFNLLLFMCNYAFEPFKHLLFGMEDNVSFMEIECEFRGGCDWCSLCNGICETVRINLQRNPDAPLDITKLEILNSYFDIVLANRKTKVVADEWCLATFGKITRELLLFSQLYLKVEQIELRWCPFKRSRETYYRNKDARYLEPSVQMMYEVGKILATNDTITCNNCPKLLNQCDQFPKATTPSLFQPLLDAMLRDILSLNITK
jgi:hypothetical protein